MQPYSSIDTLTAWKNSRSILSERSDFYMIIYFSIAVKSKRMLTLLSIDEMLLPGYVNWSTNFRGLPFNEEMLISPVFTPFRKGRGCFSREAPPLELS